MPYAANGVGLKRFFENRRTTLQFCLSLLLPFNHLYYHYFQVKKLLLMSLIVGILDNIKVTHTRGADGLMQSKHLKKLYKF
jgi:hypothetical protein